MLSIIKVIIIFVLTYIASYIAFRFEQKHACIRAVVPAVIASIAVGLSLCYDNWDKARSIPEIKIETELKESSISIKLSNGNRFIQSAHLEVPVLGGFAGFNDSNFSADAKATCSVRVSGMPPIEETIKRLAQGEELEGKMKARHIFDFVEICIQDIKPNVKLDYSIRRGPAASGWVIPNADRYRFSHTWQYKGDVYSDTQWKLLGIDEETEEPKMIVHGPIEVYNFEKNKKEK